jgi:proteasome lid subunit RPN8/RPN11
VHACTESNLTSVPPIQITREALGRIMCSICSRPPETGGILLGPVDGNDVTDFYFDYSARCTGGTYAPDHITLRQKMKGQWLPIGIDMKGFVHSHPGALDRPSAGDMVYIARLLEKNPEMPFFVAPIVIPLQFRIEPYVVLRDDPQRAHRTRFRSLFQPPPPQLTLRASKENR